MYFNPAFMLSCLTQANPISTRFFSSSTWLPIEYTINFKIVDITFNTWHYSQPVYLHFLLCFNIPVRSLGSSSTNLLTVPFAHAALGTRNFSVASRKIWNSLPPALRSCNCPDTFRRHLKTHYSQQAFSPLGTSLLVPQIRHLLTLCASINFNYLLTYLLTD